MSIIQDNKISIFGPAQSPMLLSHGFGCDQTMWRGLTPHLTRDHQIILYDLTGMGRSDRRRYDFNRYSTLDAHAEDIIEILDELDLKNVTLVGHSVSAITAVLAANAAPERIARLILVSPSPCFLNDGDYSGGFERADLEGILELMDENYLGWAQQFGPVIEGTAGIDPDESELTRSFCQTDPQIARHFGRVTFLSDRRDDMSKCPRPALILQCKDDAIAPVGVGEWMHEAMPDSTLEVLPVTGHCPHMTAPDITVAAIRSYLGEA